MKRKTKSSALIKGTRKAMRNCPPSLLYLDRIILHGPLYKEHAKAIHLANKVYWLMRHTRLLPPKDRDFLDSLFNELEMDLPRPPSPMDLDRRSMQYRAIRVARFLLKWALASAEDPNLLRILAQAMETMPGHGSVHRFVLHYCFAKDKEVRGLPFDGVQHRIPTLPEACQALSDSPLGISIDESQMARVFKDVGARFDKRKRGPKPQRA